MSDKRAIDKDVNDKNVNDNKPYRKIAIEKDTAKPNPRVDNFTQYILSKIDPQVFKTLNLVQLEAISRALAGTDKSRRHSFDFRGTIPLFFRRYYYVILAGRDRRSVTRNIEAGRRKSTNLIAALLMFYCMACGAVFFCLLALYLLKSFLGIDLFVDKHLWDWFL